MQFYTEGITWCMQFYIKESPGVCNFTLKGSCGVCNFTLKGSPCVCNFTWPRQLHAIVGGFISVSEGWVLLHKELVLAEHSPT